MTTAATSSSHCGADLERTTLAPWEVAEEDFPHGGSKVEKWKFFISYAVLAPSSHNTQPWLFRICGDQLELYADRTRACHVSDPTGRELVMSCGCALFMLKAAMTHFGYFGWIDLIPNPNDPDLLARITLGAQREKSPEEALIFYAIPKRRTNRQPFRDEPLPPTLITALQTAAAEESARLHLIDGEEQRFVVANLIAEGDRRQWSNKSFRLELAAWVHANRDGARDGIPGYAQGVDDLMSYAGPLVVRTFNMGDGQAAKNHELATGSPALVILTTEGDGPRDWLEAGQALAKVLLRGRVEDVWASFLNQPLEVPDLRPRINAALGLGGYPQACLRLGFGEEIKPTPRRGAQSVVI